MAKTGPRINVMLISTGKDEHGNDTKTSYTTTVNTRNTPKLERMKFDRRAWCAIKQAFGKYVIFKQKKIPK